MKPDFLRSMWRFKCNRRNLLYTTTAESIQRHSTLDFIRHEYPIYFNAQLRISLLEWIGTSEIEIKSFGWNANHYSTNSICISIYRVLLQKYRLTIFRKTAANTPVLELQHRVHSGLFYHDQNVQFLKNRLLRCYFKSQLLFVGDLGSITVSFKLALLQSQGALEATAYWMWIQQIPPEGNSWAILLGGCGIQVQNVQQTPMMFELKKSIVLVKSA